MISNSNLKPKIHYLLVPRCKLSEKTQKAVLAFIKTKTDKDYHRKVKSSYQKPNKAKISALKINFKTLKHNQL